MKRCNSSWYLLFSALPLYAHAHTGLTAQHGEGGALAYWFHLLTEPDHLALLAGSVAIVWVMGRKAWRLRQSSQKPALTKAHDDAR